MYALGIPFCNLDQIYKSGQAFRWIRMNDGKYIIPWYDKAVKVTQQRDWISFDCSEEDFFNIWWNYFDIGTDYQELYFQMKNLDGENRIAANRAKGIHILSQPTFETIIACVLEANTSIERTREMMNGIAQCCGKKHKQAMKEAGQVIWYEFPTPEQIVKGQDWLTTQECGYKKKTIIALCQDIIDGWLDLDELEIMDHDEAIEHLTQFEGIGPKVAESICLYALHLMESFPIDRHIEDSFEKQDMTKDEFFEWFVYDDKIKANAGLLRQYLWYHEVNPPTDGRIEKWMQE